MKTKLTMIIIIVALIFGLLFIHSKYTEDIKKYQIEYKLKKDSLQKINDTQYKKLIADTLTISELRKEVKRLGIENIKKPRAIVEVDVKIKDKDKKVDTIILPSEYVKLQVVDYYPNKEKPFVKYSIIDSIGTFKFYPVKIDLVVSENKDGTFQVDTKMPEYFEITNITARGNRTPNTYKRSSFYIGGGIQKQNNEYPVSILAGVKVKNTIIIGGFNTKGQAEIKTLYNLK